MVLRGGHSDAKTKHPRRAHCLHKRDHRRNAISRSADHRRYGKMFKLHRSTAEKYIREAVRKGNLVRHGRCGIFRDQRATIYFDYERFTCKAPVSGPNPGAFTIMTNQQLIAAAEHAARHVPTTTAQLITALVRAVQQGEELVRKLEAESVALKEACGGDGSYRGCPACTHSQYIEAPCTDTFLAPLRTEAGTAAIARFTELMRTPGDDPFIDAIAQGVTGAADNFAAQLCSLSIPTQEVELVKGGQS